MTNVKSLLAMYVKMGGSLTDTYSDIAGGIPVGQYSTISDAILACSKKYSSGGGLPADFPAEGAANKNKFLGFDNSGDYAALDAPSGAEKFLVTLTADDSGAETVWTADKTLEEIAEADGDGKIVVAKAIVDKIGIELEFAKTTIFSVEDDGTTIYVAAFSAMYCEEPGQADFFSIVGTNRGEGDEWGLVEATNQLVDVPSVYEVVLTLSGNTITGDKTFGEVAEAYFAGKTVRCNIYVDNVVKASSTVINVDGTAGLDYSVALPIGATVTELTGDVNDYITATLSN